MSDNTDLELEKLRLKRMQQFLSTESQNKTNLKIPDGIVHLTDSNFEIFLNDYSDMPIFVDYWAEWCQPCKRVGPIIEALENRYRGKMIFAKLDTDRNQITARKHNIYSIPTFNIFYKSNLIDTFSGALPGQKFEERVKNILKRVSNR